MFPICHDCKKPVDTPFNLEFVVAQPDAVFCESCLIDAIVTYAPELVTVDEREQEHLKRFQAWRKKMAKSFPDIKPNSEEWEEKFMEELLGFNEPEP